MSIVLQGSTSGSITLQEPAIAGNTVLSLPATTGTVLTSASPASDLPSSINGPAFSAYSNAIQTITGGSFTQVSFQVEEFDTNSNFASNTFTPTVAGYYQMTFNVKASATTTLSRFIVSVYKNGATTGRQWDCDLDSNSAWFVNGSKLLYCNGTTDAITLYVYTEGTGTITIGSTDANTNYFSGVLVRSA